MTKSIYYHHKCLTNRIKYATIGHNMKEVKELPARLHNLFRNIGEALARKPAKRHVLQSIELETEERGLDNPALGRIVKLYLQSRLGRPLQEIYTRVSDKHPWADEFQIYKKYRLTENRTLAGLDYIRRLADRDRSVIGAFTSVLDIELGTSDKVAVREIGLVNYDEFRFACFPARKWGPPAYNQYAYRSFEVSQEGDNLVVDLIAGMELYWNAPDYTQEYVSTYPLRRERITLQNSQGIPYKALFPYPYKIDKVIDIVPQWHAGAWWVGNQW